jgi:hypothetical protein
MTTEQDRLDALDEDSLYRYLTDTAAKRCEYLEIEKRTDGWVAEIWSEGGKVTRRVAFAAGARDRRTAMLRLARRYRS